MRSLNSRSCRNIYFIQQPINKEKQEKQTIQKMQFYFYNKLLILEKFEMYQKEKIIIKNKKL